MGPNGGVKRTFTEMLLYRLDRTSAIYGLIAIGITAILLKQNEIAMGATGALAAFLGGKLK